ncbi:ATP-binding protein [Ruminococcus sp. HUN007]|uniref:AAA family ATPase n=1 Tax=Ruminococcus sp. HUN007 TaxID=1514668 RepID=UPI0005D1A515|nr:ATP-binding protein [Ruminococcus sp. HUN007]
MLIDFRFCNSRSFYEETELSMRATDDDTFSELNTFNVGEKILPEDDNELIKSAVIFGGNASGKTNVLKAFAYMSNFVRLSSAHVLMPNESFAFKTDADKENSFYEVEIIQNGIYYKYGFKLNNGIVKHEWLYKREETLAKVFERKNEKLEIDGVSEESINLIKVPDNTLFLSIGNNFNLSVNKYLSEVMNWFLNVLIVFENSYNSLDIYNMENYKYKIQALEILNKADIGITDFEIIKDKIATSSDRDSLTKLNIKLQSDPSVIAGQLKAELESLYKIDMKTYFNVFDNEDNIVDKKEVMLFKDNGFNSEGTVRLICYLGWILAALDQGRVVFIDEIDSKLHFLVVDYLLKLFNSIEHNPKNAQIICTAHNVLLMDENFRRDQIYFTSKDHRGRSSLVSLADYTGVSKNDLFSKKYLAGFYASLPNFSREKGEE